MRTKHFSILLIVVVLLTMTLPPVHADNSQPGAQPVKDKVIEGQAIAAYDITTTSGGQSFAREAAKRWSLSGVNVDQATVRVYNLGTPESPDIVVMPAELTLNLVTVKNKLMTDKDGKQRKVVDVDTVVTMSPSKSSSDLIANAVNAAEWQMMGQKCMSRLENESGWMDTCYKTHRLTEDGDSTKDYWQLEMYATAKSKSHWILRTARIEASKASNSPSMAWVDWSPRADQSAGNCTSVSIGVTVKAVGIGASHDLCDKWDITKYAEAGKFKNEWQGPAYAWWNWQAERDVAFMEAVAVSQNAWPVWTLNYGYTAQP